MCPASNSLSHELDSDDTLLPGLVLERVVFECLYRLKDLSWTSTGLSQMREDLKNISDWLSPAFCTLIGGSFYGEFTPPNFVLYRIWQRQCYLQAQQVYSEIFHSKLQALPRQQAKDAAAKDYSDKIVKKMEVLEPAWPQARASQVAQQILKTASRWAALVNVCESIEVILLIQECQYSSESSKSIGDVIEYGTSEEFEHLRKTLLGPQTKFTEDILRLSGVVRMVENVAFSSKESELRGILGEEIRERLQFWAQPTTPNFHSAFWPENLKQDRDMDILKDWDINTVFGILISFTFPDESSSEDTHEDQIRQQQAHSATEPVDEFSSNMDTDGLLIQDEEYDAWIQNCLSLSPLSPASSPNAPDVSPWG